MSDDNGKIILQGNVLENKIHHLPFRKQPNLQCDRDPSTNETLQLTFINGYPNHVIPHQGQTTALLACY